MSLSNEIESELAVNNSLMGLAPNVVASAYSKAGTTVVAAGDILSNSKVMALAIPGTIAVFLIVLGSVLTVRKLKEGVGEALLFQVGIIVVGVVIALSIGIAAAVTDLFIDHGVVDQKYYNGDVWGQ